jgi:hypothetical protein
MANLFLAWDFVKMIPELSTSIPETQISNHHVPPKEEAQYQSM